MIQHQFKKCHQQNKSKAQSHHSQKYNKTELETYYHACCFSPTQSTFICAIENGYFISWPGLTQNLTSKMPQSINTAKVHLTQERSNLQSTKSQNINDDFFPHSNPSNIKTNILCTSIKNSPIDRAYTDLTGRFPVQSSCGNNYVMVCYSYDENAILAEALKNRSASEIVKAWKK